MRYLTFLGPPRAVMKVHVLIPIADIGTRFRWQHPEPRDWAVASARCWLAQRYGEAEADAFVLVAVDDEPDWYKGDGPAIGVWFTHPNAPLASEVKERMRIRLMGGMPHDLR